MPNLVETETVTHEPMLPRWLELLLFIATSTAMIVPCFWQEHIQAGDLSSHVYNAWLATEIKSGAVDGLSVVTVWTNVLSDWALEGLMRVAGTMWAERLVVAAAVLLFFWGAFCLIQVVTGRRPWLLAPCLAMLSYGLVFQLGFLNYYIASGLCFWMLAILWHPTRLRILAAIPLAILALLAHAFPLMWALAIIGYLQLARRLRPDRTPLMLFVGFVAVGLLQAILLSQFPYRWSQGPLISLSGLFGLTAVEQVWLYGTKYLIVVGGLLLIWSLLFLERLDQRGMLGDPVAQLWILHLFAFLLLPAAIQFPAYQHTLAYIPQRISLFAGVLLCAMVGGARYGRGMTRLSGVVATIFFVFLYLDNRAFNDAENDISALVASVPAGGRVVAAMTDSAPGPNGLNHILDRPCIGHCFSYGNYEPATQQFRIRVTGPTRTVAPTMDVVKEIDEGRHIVQPQEAPLYAVCPCEKSSNERFCLRTLHAGERTCSFSIFVSPQLWSDRAAGMTNLARENQREIPDH